MANHDLHGYALCACSHARRMHSPTGICQFPTCACFGFEEPEVTRKNRRNRRSDRDSDERERRVRVLRKHVLAYIQLMQAEGNISEGDDLALTLTDRVEAFVLRMSERTCEVDELLNELVSVLREPSASTVLPRDPVLFPRGVAEELLDVIVTAAHDAHDTIFQEMA